MVAEGLADILCSDYSPMSLLSALFQSKAISNRPLYEVVPLLSLNPARAVGSHRIGSIEEGKDADLILVRTDRDTARIILTIVCGNIVYASPDHN
jgi:alpha-D-ribose 1-methylphosphonate 5-triphosphate diphosphatase PhnM